MDEASANFKDIVERALENGDSLELERDGHVIGTVRPQERSPKSSLRNMFEELSKLSPVDETFAGDLQAAIDAQDVKVPENRWED